MRRTAFFFLILFAAWAGFHVSEASQQWSRTKPEVNLSHIFSGVINTRGKPTGFHSRPGGENPSSARVVTILSQPNRQGVYSARVEIYDSRDRVWKKKFSTFFPDSMEREEVISAILNAYRHRVTSRKQPWSGPSGHGFQIQGYLNRRGNINTAFPVYQKN